MKLLIITAEPKNFVPLELEKHAKEQGHEVQIVDITKTALIEQSTTKDVVSKVVFQPCHEEGEEPKLIQLEAPFVCIPRLNEHDLEYKLGVLRRLELHGGCLLNSAESMALCNDKLGSQVVLNNSGVRTPWSMAVGSVDMLEPALQLAEADGNLKFPMIVKTLRGTHGIGVMKVDSRSSLVSVAQAFIAHGAQIMLQEFIEHDKSARIIMIGEQMLAANLRMQPKEKDEFRTNSHLGSTTQKYEPSEEELAIGRKIVDLFGCRFCAIDYIMVGDEIIVLEVNGSPGLEAIQKDWEGERELAKLVVEYCATLDCGNVQAPTVQDDTTAEVEEPEVTVAPEAPVSQADQPLADVEKLSIIRLTTGDIDARVDTGAAYSSLHVDKVEELNDWIRFTRGEITYKVPIDRQIKIRNAHGKNRRPVIKLDVMFRGNRFNQVEFTITDRAGMKYEALIGRNLLKMIGLPVMVYNDDGSQLTATDPSDIEIEEE